MARTCSRARVDRGERGEDNGSQDRFRRARRNRLRGDMCIKMRYWIKDNIYVSR